MKISISKFFGALCVLLFYYLVFFVLVIVIKLILEQNFNKLAFSDHDFDVLIFLLSATCINLIILKLYPKYRVYFHLGINTRWALLIFSSAILLGITNLLLQSVFGIFEFDSNLDFSAISLSKTFYVVIFRFIHVAVEELLIHGVPFLLIADKLGKRTALLLLAIIFAFVHQNTMVLPVIEIFYLLMLCFFAFFVAGFLIGYIILKYGNILYGIIFHFGYNLIISFFWQLKMMYYFQ